jgi:hypothetical protein
MHRDRTSRRRSCSSAVNWRRQLSLVRDDRFEKGSPVRASEVRVFKPSISSSTRCCGCCSPDKASARSALSALSRHATRRGLLRRARQELSFLSQHADFVPLQQRRRFEAPIQCDIASAVRQVAPLHVFSAVNCAESLAMSARSAAGNELFSSSGSRPRS